MNPRLHLKMHEIVATQLWDDSPPEVWDTAARQPPRPGAKPLFVDSLVEVGTVAGNPLPAADPSTSHSATVPVVTAVFTPVRDAWNAPDCCA